MLTMAAGWGLSTGPSGGAAQPSRSKEAERPLNSTQQGEGPRAQRSWCAPRACVTPQRCAVTHTPRLFWRLLPKQSGFVYTRLPLAPLAAAPRQAPECLKNRWQTEDSRLKFWTEHMWGHLFLCLCRFFFFFSHAQHVLSHSSGIGSTFSLRVNDCATVWMTWCTALNKTQDQSNKADFFHAGLERGKTFFFLPLCPNILKKRRRLNYTCKQALRGSETALTDPGFPCANMESMR